MHTVEMLEQALVLVERLGYEVREEWLGGNGGGGCELKGRKVFFLDLALDPTDQLESVLETLRHQREAVNLTMPGELHTLLAPRKSA